MTDYYGPIIKKIRLSKGYSQKETYAGIISKSFAILFEKGKHDLTLLKFEKLLTRLNLSYEEFIYIKQNYRASYEHFLYGKIANAANNQDSDYLREIYRLLDGSKNEADRHHAAFTLIAMKQKHLLPHDNQKNEELAVEKASEIITEYLLKVDTWYLEEINLFINTIAIFNYDLMLLLLKKSLNILQKYQEMKEFPTLICALLTNSLSIILDQKDWYNFKCYLQELSHFSEGFDTLFFKIIYKFYDGIYEMHSTHCATGEEKAQTAIFILKELEQTTYATAFSVYLDKFKQTEKL